MEIRTEIEFPGTRVIDVFELLCGCWEFNLGPLQVQPVHLTNEPSLYLQLKDS